MKKLTVHVRGRGDVTYTYEAERLGQRSAGVVWLEGADLALLVSYGTVVGLVEDDEVLLTTQHYSLTTAHHKGVLLDTMRYEGYTKVRPVAQGTLNRRLLKHGFSGAIGRAPVDFTQRRAK